MPKRIVMYTSWWCPDCRAAKAYLRGKGLTWEEIDIEKDPAAAARVAAWSGGYRTVPIFDIDGAIVIDFDRRKLEQVLAD